MEAGNPLAESTASMTFAQAFLPKRSFEFLQRFEALVGIHNKNGKMCEDIQWSECRYV